MRVGNKEVVVVSVIKKSSLFNTEVIIFTIFTLQVTDSAQYSHVDSSRITQCALARQH